MKSLQKFFLPMLMVCMGIQHNLLSQTDILGGDVSGSWLQTGSPYRILHHIKIPKDSTLSIEPGVLVEFQGYYRINVQGQILAKGQEASRIVFTGPDTTGLSDLTSTTGGWNGIRFIDTRAENDSSIFEYCDFQYGKVVADQWHDNSGGAICVVNFNKIRISHCTFKHNYAGGIEVPAGGAIHLCWSDIVLEHNKFHNNIAEAGGAIYLHESSPVFRYNVVKNNQALNGGGISIGYLSKPVFQGDSIIQNSAPQLGGGIICWDSTVVNFQNVVVEDNNARWGAGIGMTGVEADLDSCIIQNNHAVDLGGGIAADFSEVSIENSSYSSNSASMSGGMHSWYSILEFSNTEFTNNAADFGAGLHADFSELEFMDCNFKENQAEVNGGGLHIWNSDLEILRSSFTQNTSVSEGGAMEYNLGDTLIFGRPYQLQINESQFVENDADFRAGGIKIEQFTGDSSMANVVIDQCEFLDNHAERIAAIRMHGNLKDFELANSKINNNTTDLWNGGASFSGGSTGRIINCEFAKNVATSGNPGASGVSNGSFAHYINCTFYHNTAGSVGGLSVHRDGKASITNCIFWDNYPQQVSARGIREGAFSELYVNYCNIQHGLDSIEIDTLATVHWVDGNMDADPLFLDPENGDFQLVEGSPCIDAGIDQIKFADITVSSPQLDILGNPRTQVGSFSPDIGAYEYQPITFLADELTSKHFNISIYPNPFRKQIMFDIHKSEPANIYLKIYNLQGVVVYKTKIQKSPTGNYRHTWNPSYLTNGIYMCRIKLDQEIITRKILLIK